MSARILLVSVAGAASERIAEPLSRRGHDVVLASKPSEVSQQLGASDLVILDAGSPTALVEVCRRVRTMAPGGPPIMAIAHGRDIEERITLIEAGADDVLSAPFDPRQLELLSEAMLSRGGSALPSAAPSAAGLGQATAAAAFQHAGGPGRVICFAAAKGGAGTTTLAVNTAVGLAGRGMPVALADLDFHHGQVAAHLNVVAQRSTAEMAAAIDPEEGRHGLSDVAITHSSGLVVYAAPTRPDQASAVGTDEVIELIRWFRDAHPLTIVDAGSVPGSRALSLLGLADQAIIVVAPDIPGLRALTGTLAAMADHGLAGEQNVFVVNRTFGGQTIGRTDIERHLGVEVVLDVPFDGDSCLRAVNEGQPVLTLNPRSPVSAAIDKLCALIAGEPPASEGEEAPRKGRFGSLRPRRPG